MKIITGASGWGDPSLACSSKRRVQYLLEQPTKVNQ
jgi:hypothetical protein